MKLKRIVSLCLCLVMLLSLAACASAKPEDAASKYPSEQVITWYTQNAGNVADTIARILIPYLEKELGQTIVVENLGGAGGMNQMNPMLANDANGYSFASLGVAFLCLTPFSQDCTYDYTNFDMICNFFSQPQAVFVSADAPYNTFEEWADYVKNNPGEFTVGTPGASTVHNIAMQGLKLETGLDYDVIYYTTAEEAFAALMGGHINAYVSGFNEGLSGVESGDFKVLAFTTETKAEGYEDIPSFADLGYESRGVAFQGVVIEAGTDPEIAAKIKAAFEAVLTNPEAIEQLKTAKCWYEGTVQYSEQFTETVKSTYEWYEKVLTDTGLMEELYG